MTPLIATALVIVASYLLGSLSFAVIISRLMGLSDPRSYGSKNPGATNVLRSGNKAAAVITLLLDGAKGFAAVYLAQHFADQLGTARWVPAAAGVAAFLGHLYPVFFRFVGGKGVATALGVLLAINFWMGFAALGIWLIMAAFFRYSSLASLTSVAFAPVYRLANEGADWTMLAIVLMGALLAYRHKQNISNLMNGKESKLGAKAEDAKKPQPKIEAKSKPNSKPKRGAKTKA